ncbi:MAG TPA: hypothetical protein VKY60_02310 [Burkholderiaceae bacterium]|nr:hypothetical protein [Burkholderiaceae bacterium]
MQSEGRRAFLRGRRPASTPWEQFYSRLRTVAAGEVTLLETASDRPAARLLVQRPADVHHALRLCREHGVCLALDGVPSTASQPGPVLWLRPGRDLSACRRLEPTSNRWFVQPGCLLGELEAAGLTAFAEMPAHLTVAAWLADRSLCNWATGSTASSGLVHASALLGDGVSVSLGAFGTENRKALDNLRLQKLIPSLFSLASGCDGNTCAERATWPARYRLDALLPARQDTLNLSHLLLGHGGDLAWVEWVVIDADLADPAAGANVPLELPGVEAELFEDDSDYGDGYSMGGGDLGGSGPCEQVNLIRAAQEIDAGVKALFDPEGVFPHPGQLL